MKTFIFCLLIIMPVTCHSQFYRFIYEYSFVKDTISQKKFSMRYYLDISPQKVKFYNEELYHLDSIQKLTKETTSMTVPASVMVERMLGSDENMAYKFIDSDYYKIKSKDKLRWNIDSETKIYNNFPLQKANTKYGGRLWTAWFCKDIIISEGPYKFRGLPGLIFEIEDVEGNFKFKLVEVRKISSEYNTENILESNFGKKALAVSVEKYNKILIDAYNNPFSELRTKMEMGEDFTLSIYGKQIKTVKDLDSIKRLRQSDIRKNYNPIELDKAVKYNSK
ncbi:GLPGLI family protein [Chryseobacterium sp. KACC 21268]|nr:GLPGLI family protein [Chryseobacterium sp. KACC 21268]